LATPSLTGKTVLVTGATTGLGLECAVQSVQAGASRVIITARTASKGAEAQRSIEERTSKKNVVEPRILDMDTLLGVKEFTNAFKADKIYR